MTECQEKKRILIAPEEWHLRNQNLFLLHLPQLNYDAFRLTWGCSDPFSAEDKDK